MMMVGMFQWWQSKLRCVCKDCFEFWVFLILIGKWLSLKRIVLFNVSEICNCVDKEDKVHEQKVFKGAHSYENICKRVVGKCSFLLFAVQPAILGENTFSCQSMLIYAAVMYYNMQICCC